MADENKTPDGEDTNEEEYLVSDRDRGILTSHDREYLLGEKELDGQDERNARYRIRQRAIQAFRDMKLIAMYVDRDDRGQIANELKDHEIRAGIHLTYGLIAADPDVTEALSEFERMVDKMVVSSYEVNSEKTYEPGVYARNASVEINAGEKQIISGDNVPSRSEFIDNPEDFEGLEEINSIAEESEGVSFTVVYSNQTDEDD